MAVKGTEERWNRSRFEVEELTIGAPGSQATLTTTELGFLDGVTAGTAAASKAVVLGSSKEIATITTATITNLASTSIDAVTLTNANLVLESLNPLTIKLNDTDALQLDNAAISGFAAATDTAGNDVYLQAEDAGATATAARVGGRLNLKTGVGSDGASAVIAGAGGLLNLRAAAGGAASGTAAGGASGSATMQTSVGGAHTGGGATGAGGAGGALALTGGAGGATSNVGSDNGGAGSNVGITAGIGGAASAGTGDGGAGGTITLTAGGSATSAGGVAGAPGSVTVGAGILLQGAQVIGMNDAAVTLTVVPGTPSGTLMTGNVLEVDPEGNTEILKLPPEADMVGAVIHVINTGGESITLQDDGGGAIATIATTKHAIAFCGGNAWGHVLLA